MKNVSTIVLAASLLTLVSCGDDSSSKTSSQAALVSDTGHFKATLIPMNNHIAGDVSGDANLEVLDGKFSVEVKVNGAPSQIMHTQAIHIGSSCPTLASDANNDGIIDAVEGSASYGPLLIPLDGKLETQRDGITKFPRADFSGNYYYGQSASLEEMLVDLRAQDDDLEDSMVKIDVDALTLVGRHIVIYGVSSRADLPESVMASNGQSKHASLPIACGTIVKMDPIEEGTTSGSNGGKE